MSLAGGVGGVLEKPPPGEAYLPRKSDEKMGWGEAGGREDGTS